MNASRDYFSKHSFSISEGPALSLQRTIDKRLKTQRSKQWHLASWIPFTWDIGFARWDVASRSTGECWDCHDDVQYQATAIIKVCFVEGEEMYFFVLFLAVSVRGFYCINMNWKGYNKGSGWLFPSGNEDICSASEMKRPTLMVYAYVCKSATHAAWSKHMKESWSLVMLFPFTCHSKWTYSEYWTCRRYSTRSTCCFKDATSNWLIYCSSFFPAIMCNFLVHTSGQLVGSWQASIAWVWPWSEHLWRSIVLLTCLGLPP